MVTGDSDNVKVNASQTGGGAARAILVKNVMSKWTQEAFTFGPQI